MGFGIPKREQVSLTHVPVLKFKLQFHLLAECEPGWLLNLSVLQGSPAEERLHGMYFLVVPMILSGSKYHCICVSFCFLLLSNLNGSEFDKSKITELRGGCKKSN